MSPATYQLLSATTSDLLSRLWNELNFHVDHGASRNVTAIIAYIFSTTSQPYLESLSESVGVKSTQGDRRLDAHRAKSSLLPFGELAEHEASMADAEFAMSATPPSFLPVELADRIPRAQQSLHLLAIAAPEHAVLFAKPTITRVRWVWTLVDIKDAFSGTAWSHSADATTSAGIPTSTSPSKLYKPEISDLRKFDLLPGSEITIHNRQESAGVRHLEHFVATFPDQLPLLTPTLPALAELVLDPVSQQATLLSGSLVSVFLSPTTDLYLVTHLEIMRSFFLTTSPAFKDLLGAALFSSAYEPTAAVSRTIRDSRRGRKTSGEGPWSVGLASGLCTRDDWPPRDSDLSFHLRSVIVDSLSASSAMVGDTGASDIWKQAETRLGFAIRDLPVRTGKEGWLTPHCEHYACFLRFFIDMIHLSSR
jgi:hypothetical protein